MKRVYHALLSSQPILNNKEMFGPINGALFDVVNNKLDTVFGGFGEGEFLFDDQSR